MKEIIKDIRYGEGEGKRERNKKKEKTKESGETGDQINAKISKEKEWNKES
jgi:hypothetical protein